jgi:gamma-glutamyltranspeptidase/glutathione hydrolase
MVEHCATVVRECFVKGYRMFTGYLPYESRRSPVAASNLVATSQPLAVQAGLQALRLGGNAVDAALSAAITLTVVEPTGNGVGSDAFALVWDGRRLHGFNGSGRSPKAWNPTYFSAYDTMPQFGWGSVTVPGAVDLWRFLSAQFGKLEFEQLFESAIHYAEKGFLVGFRTAFDWNNGPADWYRDFPEFCKNFLPPPQVGERYFRRDLGKTLRILSGDPRSIYEGSIAEKIIGASDLAQGALSHEDLASHETEQVVPIDIQYRDVVVHEIPPNGQGLAVLIALGILNKLDSPPCDSVESVHLQIEVMKIGLHTAARRIADPSHMEVSIETMLDPEGLGKIADSIGSHASGIPPLLMPQGHDTVYLSAADDNGMMVSFIQSNYFGFGSGIVIPDSGITMQNRGWGFSLEEGHPNQVGSNKKPFHTIIPGFITRNGSAFASFGVMGGPMQAQGHVQMVSRLVDYNQNPQAASDAPRWQVLADYTVSLEPGFSENIANGLITKGHDVVYAKDSSSFGGAQLIARTECGYTGGSDHRKEGQVAGF